MKYDEALRNLDEAIRLNPNFGNAFENRANTYSALNQHQNAIRDFTEALRVRPKEGEYYMKRAVAYTALKDYHKAVQDYTEAIRLLSNNLRAYRGRALVEDLMGETAAANADRRFVRDSKKERRSDTPRN
jgi:tetratricopeptide (TPR) repeat protein